MGASGLENRATVKRGGSIPLLSSHGMAGQQVDDSHELVGPSTGVIPPRCHTGQGRLPERSIGPVC